MHVAHVLCLLQGLLAQRLAFGELLLGLAPVDRRRGQDAETVMHKLACGIATCLALCSILSKPYSHPT